MNGGRIKISNGQIITPYQIIPDGTLILTDGLITCISDSKLEVDVDLEIDAEGKWVAPGFIDIHVHGGGGHDFMDGSVNAFTAIADMHVRYGTTAMFPTTLTSGKEELIHILSIYEEAVKENRNGCQFMGLHLEGPYIALSQKGAQDPRYIRNPDPGEYKEVVKRFPSIRRWSAAPELPGALPFGEFLLSRRILPAIAHTDAIYEEVLEAFEKGYTHATHFYSAMSGVTRRNGFRYAGVIESGYLIDGMTVEIIADGVHLPAALLKLVYKIKGADRTALITDAMRAAGMPQGESILGGLTGGIRVIVEDGVAKLPDRSFFAGSVATTDQLLRNMILLAEVPLVEAVKMITLTPARIMGIASKKGSIELGKDADLVIFDEDIRIEMTMVNGKLMYSRGHI